MCIYLVASLACVESISKAAIEARPYTARYSSFQCIRRLAVTIICQKCNSEFEFCVWCRTQTQLCSHPDLQYTLHVLIVTTFDGECTRPSRTLGRRTVRAMRRHFTSTIVRDMSCSKVPLLVSFPTPSTCNTSLFGPTVHTSIPEPKRHFDQFSHSCVVHPSATRATCVAKDRRSTHCVQFKICSARMPSGTISGRSVAIIVSIYYHSAVHNR